MTHDTKNSPQKIVNLFNEFTGNKFDLKYNDKKNRVEFKGKKVFDVSDCGKIIIDKENKGAFELTKYYAANFLSLMMK